MSPANSCPNPPAQTPARPSRRVCRSLAAAPRLQRKRALGAGAGSGWRGGAGGARRRPARPRPRLLSGEAQSGGGPDIPAPPLPARGRRAGLGARSQAARSSTGAGISPASLGSLACLAGWLATCGSSARSAESPAPAGRPGRRQPRRAPTCRSSRGATVSATSRVRAGRAPGTATWRPPGRGPGSASRDNRGAGDGGLGT